MTALEVRLRPVLLACLTFPLALSAQEPDLDELLQRAADWVAGYERELGALVAEESYSQRATTAPHLRELFSEFVMEEEYQFRQSRVNCVARYSSNYRRFETSGRVIP